MLKERTDKIEKLKIYVSMRLKNYISIFFFTYEHNIFIVENVLTLDLTFKQV